MGGNCCEQVETNVCGRGSMRNYGDWIFLKIIRRKPVVVSANEGLKETPCAPRNQPSISNICRAYELPLDRQWSANPISNRGRHAPNGDKYGHPYQRRGLNDQGERDGYCRKHFSRQHEPEESR